MEEILNEAELKLHGDLTDIFALFKAKLDIIPQDRIEQTLMYIAEGILNVKETLLQFKRPIGGKVIEMYPKNN